jgi:hypothetical protein
MKEAGSDFWPQSTFRPQLLRAKKQISPLWVIPQFGKNYFYLVILWFRKKSYLAKGQDLAMEEAR